MVERQKSTDADRLRRRWVLVLAVFMPLAIAAVLFTLFSVTVQADAPLATTASTLAPAAPPEALQPPPVIRLQFANPIEQMRGIASFYSDAFDGHTTANGETYDMHALTACTNALPFESVVRVVNLRNHRSVVVRINDRGLLFPGRVIDLSYAAAEKLGMMRSGLAPVRLDVLSLGKRRSAN
ncbi:MAG TPA: septal ring lytic transglycosylase RlpA family protein [Terracidiphilus sp.]|nr:septal ring lytic transglycosylase RlpA family protein [Terracidiphilus sp.]